MISMVAGVLLSTLSALPDVSATTCEFGEVYQGEATKCLIEFVNRGDAEVRVHSISAIVPGDKVDTETLLVPPKGTAHVTLQVNTDADAGIAHHPIRLRVPGVDTDGSVDSRGFVFNVFDPSPAVLDMGPVDLANSIREAKTLSVSSAEEPAARLTTPISAPPYLDVKVDKTGKEISVRVRDSAPWGLFEQTIVVGVEGARQKRYGVKVKGDVRGSVVPGANPVALDLIRRGSGSHDFIIPISDTSGNALKLGAITLDKLKGSVRETPCVPESKNCRWLRLNISDEQPSGKIDGAVLVTLPDYKRSLPIWVWGLMVNADTVIHDGSTVSPTAAAKNGEPSAPAESAVVQGGKLIDQIKKAAAPAAPVEVPGKGPLLRWQVENEVSIYGYVIYRADSAEGPWRRMNDKIVAAQNIQDSASSYAWRDTSAASGKKYWYYIGTIARNGERKRFTSPSEVTAK